MKLSKNNIIAATLTVAFAFGCANFADSTLNTPVAEATSNNTEIAKADLDKTLFHGGARAEVIIVIPD